MDVVRLNASSYLPESLIEGYNSMVWSERSLENGDFEMKTAQIDATLALVPEGQPISLLDSAEVMIADTQSVDVDAEGDKILTITGRTLEAASLDDRYILATVYNELFSTLKQYTTSEIVALLLWNELVNTTGQDPTRAATTRETLTPVPGLTVTDSTTLADAARTWWLDKGPVYPQIRDFLNLNHYGLRNIRPMDLTANVMTFDTSGTAARGNVTKTATPHLNQLRMDVYNGVDRSRQNSVTPVIFHYDSGHIDSPKYLFSRKDLKNVAVIGSSTAPITVYSETGSTVPPAVNPSGLNRHILYVDGGDQGDQLLADFVASITQKGLLELAKHNRIRIVDGAISPVSPYKYNVDYSLGDKVTLMAEYGFDQTMIVSEYIRTEDLEGGERGYPTLILAS